MEASTKKRWMPTVGVLLSVIGSCAALAYLSFHTYSVGEGNSKPFIRFEPNDGSRGVVWPKRRPKPIGPGWSTTVLRRDRRIEMGNAIVIYRGMDGRAAFKIDIVLPKLDAQFAYSRRIEIKRSKKGFQAGGHRFMLESVGKSELRLSRYIPKP